MVQKRESGAKGERQRGNPAGPIQNPLDLLAADHSAERDACALITRIAESDSPMPDEAKRVLSFLLGTYRNHLKDEEEDLFPLLRQRCEPEDEIDRILRTLETHHHHPRSDCAPIIAILESSIEKPGAISAKQRKTLAEFADRSRRHLGIENAIILPLARARLTKADLAGLRQHVFQRRGLGGGSDVG